MNRLALTLFFLAGSAGAAHHHHRHAAAAEAEDETAAHHHRVYEVATEPKQHFRTRHHREVSALMTNDASFLAETEEAMLRALSTGGGGGSFGVGTKGMMVSDDEAPCSGFFLCVSILSHLCSVAHPRVRPISFVLCRWMLPERKWRRQCRPGFC
jgi:hypothetical protein